MMGVVRQLSAFTWRGGELMKVSEPVTHLPGGNDEMANLITDQASMSTGLPYMARIHVPDSCS